MYQQRLLVCIVGLVAAQRDDKDEKSNDPVELGVAFAIVGAVAIIVLLCACWRRTPDAQPGQTEPSPAAPAPAAPAPAAPAQAAPAQDAPPKYEPMRARRDRRARREIQSDSGDDDLPTYEEATREAPGIVLEHVFRDSAV